MSEHFVKQSYGVIWHFCHNSQGICFCTMSDEHIKEYEILLKNGQKDFDVLIDDSDSIHLICQDDAGNIIYIKNEDNSWKKYTILQSKSSATHQKNFNIQRVGNWINIIYAIDYKGKRLLSHQIIDKSDVPTAVDYIEGDFSVAKDNNENIYVLYINAGGTLGWRKFVWSIKQWSEFVPVEASGELKNPYIYVDDKIHITGLIENNVVYISDDAELVVGSTGSRPVIFKNKESLYLMWENKGAGKVWVSLSNDNGVTFQYPTEFMAGRFAPIKLFSLSYTSYEEILAHHCYGFIRDNAVTLYMLGDFFKINRIPPKPAAHQRDMNIELTKLKIQMSQLSDSIEKMDFRLDMLEKKFRESE